MQMQKIWMAVMAVAMTVGSAQAFIVVEHAGANDPTTEGFNANGDAGLGSHANGREGIAAGGLDLDGGIGAADQIDRFAHFPIIHIVEHNAVGPCGKSIA